MLYMHTHLLVVGATNMPWEIDEAVLRRLTKRIYVPLPDAEAREALIRHLMLKHQGKDAARMLGDSKSMARIVFMTQGYSGSDLTAVHIYMGYSYSWICMHRYVDRCLFASYLSYFNSLSIILRHSLPTAVAVAIAMYCAGVQGGRHGSYPAVHGPIAEDCEDRRGAAHRRAGPCSAAV
jgi:hypothetical protein